MTLGILCQGMYNALSYAWVSRISTSSPVAAAAAAAAASGRRRCSHHASPTAGSSAAGSSTVAAPVSYFAVLGVPESFRLSLDDLSAAHRRLQRAWHPDRYANADAPARSRAAQLSAAINDAYAALKAPATRASHLLAIRAARVDDQGPHDPAGAVDAELLQWAMNFRERIEDAAGQPRELADMRGEAAEQIRACCEQLGDAFGRNDLALAREETVRLHFLLTIHAAADDQLSTLETN
jgi:molecular chaperone HscB